MYLRIHFIRLPMEGSDREIVGKIYARIGTSAFANLYGSLNKVVPNAANMKIYARLGTAMIKMIYALPSLSPRPSLCLAMVIPSGRPRAYAINVAIIPITKEFSNMDNPVRL